jgi:hypothetical protein
MVETPDTGVTAYEAPELAELGTLHELTLYCDKRFGSTDGFTMQGQAIVCSSA